MTYTKANTNTMTKTMVNATKNNFDNLVAGQRYLFYGKIPVIQKHTSKSDNTTETNNTTKTNNTFETTEVLFRANFLEIVTNHIEKTIITNNVECKERGELNQCGILSTPLDWITKVEKLNDVLEE
jgi:hypothetical protein